MREIKNNLEFGKVQKPEVKTPQQDNVPTVAAPVEDEKVIKDLSNPQAEVSGRVQVSKTDTVQNDVSFGMANPKAIKSSDKLFEIAYNKLLKQGHPNAYEEACSIATQYTKEFC